MKRVGFYMFDYFWIGFKSLLKSSVITSAIYFLAFILLLILWRRYSIAKRSGGNFLSPFQIAQGNFYIHNAFVFRNRIIPLNDIKMIEVNFIPSVKLNGARYLLCIQQKSGKALAFFFGQSKESEQLVKNLKNETKKYNIKIRILET